jgi:hypothetical protein
MLTLASSHTRPMTSIIACTHSITFYISPADSAGLVRFLRYAKSLRTSSIEADFKPSQHDPNIAASAGFASVAWIITVSSSTDALVMAILTGSSYC